MSNSLRIAAIATAIVVPFVGFTAARSAGSDEATLVALNETYQHAVMTDDVPALDRILASNYLLYSSRDKPITKQGVLDDARENHYTVNASSDVQARVWGDTGVVTARLDQKGTSQDGSAFDVTVRFTDVYVRTPQGWRLVSAHATLRKPAT